MSVNQKPSLLTLFTWMKHLAETSIPILSDRFHKKLQRKLPILRSTEACLWCSTTQIWLLKLLAHKNLSMNDPLYRFFLMTQLGCLQYRDLKLGFQHKSCYLKLALKETPRRYPFLERSLTLDWEVYIFLWIRQRPWFILCWVVLEIWTICYLVDSMILNCLRIDRNFSTD